MARWDSSFPEPESFNGAPEDRHDPSIGKPWGQSYVCVDCTWHGKDPLRHYVQTGHAVRGRDWPVSMKNAQWTDSDSDGRRVTTVPTEVHPVRG